MLDVEGSHVEKRYELKDIFKHAYSIWFWPEYSKLDCKVLQQAPDYAHVDS